jgi:hypothetical protein
MGIGRQPRGAQGTPERPYSALRLRLVLAVLGIVVCGVGAGLVWAAGEHGWAVIFAALGVVALVDAIVVAIRLTR